MIKVHLRKIHDKQERIALSSPDAINVEVLALCRRLMALELAISEGQPKKRQDFIDAYSEMVIASNVSTAHLYGKPLSMQWDAYCKMGEALYGRAKEQIVQAKELAIEFKF